MLNKTWFAIGIAVAVFLVLTTLLVLVLAISTGFIWSSETCTSNGVEVPCQEDPGTSCLNFPSQQAAQVFLDADLLHNLERAKLDPDHNGIACESGKFLPTSRFIMEVGNTIYVYTDKGVATSTPR